MTEYLEHTLVMHNDFCMTIIYIHYIVRSPVCIIPNINQTLSTGSTGLTLYLVCSSSMGPTGVEYILDLIRVHKKISQGVRSGENFGQPTGPPLVIQLLRRLLFKWAVTWFEWFWEAQSCWKKYLSSVNEILQSRRTQHCANTMDRVSWY